ncbi:TIGR02221 family CRISPR-associated protein [Methanospirillum hungatei]|uniref:TIGR02221 family CRISPR-associated protein n=1 Tax=Methanospirillum hungatei TaxID=2203 RepID=UPI0026EFD3D9|nr:TIGR02221 family CRISPR-associated protein [Methanospirillum hungatei]MCA1917054.1 TIGR02221 family CRISPR-associated protein [Methanospirillum hungatei]
MTKLLSFIGTGTLYETIYRVFDEEYQTSVVQDALCRYYKPDEVVLFVTNEARSKNLPIVQAALSSIQVTLVDIPDGKCEEEIWEIFSIVTDAVFENDDIIFDITHGFRSLPFIALLSIAYLKEIKPFSLSGVVYGAFEARETILLDSGKEISRAPVFDLTGFVEIFEWMAGVRSFLYHADADKLNHMVRKISNAKLSHYQSNKKNKPLLDLVRPMGTYAASVRLARPVEAMETAFQIQERFEAVKEAIKETTPVLTPLLSRISEIEQFAVQKPKILTDIVIQKQRELIQVQLNMGLYQQAVTMGREWMVTVLLYAAGSTNDWLKKEVRYEAENSLSGAEKILIGQPKGQSHHEDEKKPMFLDWFCNHDSWKELTGIWSKVSQLRNELAHCGMNPDSQNVKQLEKKIKKFSDYLDQYYAMMLRVPK